MDKVEKENECAKDMYKLGIVAIDMYNRRSLYITPYQLNSAVDFFGQEIVHTTSRRRMSQADQLFGGFFFVHESKSVYDDESVYEHERTAEKAFEFLHNTFGEFLTADFILQRILDEVYKTLTLRQTPRLAEHADSRLAEPNWFRTDWFARLMFTPLFSRPVILDMMREWLQHLLSRWDISEQEFLNNLDFIVSDQIRHLLLGNILPPVMTERGKTPFGDLPLIGYVATYSLNLILLRTVLSSNGDGYIFNEEDILPYEGGARAWDRLTYLWRSWFSLDTLNGLTAILTAKREHTVIQLKVKDAFVTSSSKDRLDAILSTSFALADDITTGLAGLLAYDSYSNENALEIHEIGNRLEAEEVNLWAEVSLKLVHQERQQGDWGSIDSIKYIYSENRERKRGIDIAITREAIEIIKCNLELGNRDKVIYMLGEISNGSSFSDVMGMETICDLVQAIEEVRGDRSFLRNMAFISSRYIASEIARNMVSKYTIETLKSLRQYGGDSVIKVISEYLCSILRRISLKITTPKFALGMLQLARELGDQNFTDEVIRKCGRSFRHISFDRVEADIALKILHLARELDEPAFADEITYGLRNYLILMIEERAFHTNALNLLWLAQELGHQESIDTLSKNLCEELRKVRLGGRLRPNIALLFLKVVRDFGDQSLIYGISFQIGRLLVEYPYEEGNFEVASELMQLVLGFNDRSILKDTHENMSVIYSAFCKYSVKELDVKLPSMLTAKLLHLARELNDRDFISDTQGRLHHILERNIFRKMSSEAIFEILQFAQDIDDKLLCDIIYREYVSLNIEKVNSWPLGALKQLYTLAHEYDDKELLGEIDRILE